VRPGSRHSKAVWDIAAMLVLIGLGVVLPAVFGPAPAAGAHARLIGATPAAESLIDSAPTSIELTFDEPVQTVPDGLRVLAPDGTDVATSAASVDGSTIVQPVDIGGVRGSFTVSYRVLSVDGHVVAGAYVFSVGERTAAASADEREDPASRFVEFVGRTTASAGALLALGAVLLAALDAGGSFASALQRRRGILIGSALALLLGTTAILIGVAGLYAGRLVSSFGAVGDVVGATTSGAVVMARVGCAVAFTMVVAIPSVMRRFPVLVAVFAALATVAPAFGGHAVSSDVPALAVVLVAVHLVAAALWIGALGVLAIRWSEDRHLLGEYAAVAVVAAPIVVASGLVGAWIQTGGSGDAIGTSYGRLLLAKVLLAAVLLLLGWINRRSIGRVALAVVDLASSVRLEAALGLVVVAVSAVLVVTPPPVIETEPIRTEATSGDLVVSIVVDPGISGPNSIELRYADRSGSPVAVDATDLRVRTDGVEPRRLDVRAVDSSTVVADDAILTPGEWTLEATVVRLGSPSSFSSVVSIP